MWNTTFTICYLPALTVYFVTPPAYRSFQITTPQIACYALEMQIPFLLSAIALLISKIRACESERDGFYVFFWYVL